MGSQIAVSVAECSVKDKKLTVPIVNDDAYLLGNAARTSETLFFSSAEPQAPTTNSFAILAYGNRWIYGPGILHIHVFVYFAKDVNVLTLPSRRQKHDNSRMQRFPLIFFVLLFVFGCLFLWVCLSWYKKCVTLCVCACASVCVRACVPVRVCVCVFVHRRLTPAKLTKCYSWNTQLFLKIWHSIHDTVIGSVATSDGFITSTADFAVNAYRHF